VLRCIYVKYAASTREAAYFGQKMHLVEKSENTHFIELQIIGPSRREVRSSAYSWSLCRPSLCRFKRALSNEPLGLQSASGQPRTDRPGFVEHPRECSQSWRTLTLYGGRGTNGGLVMVNQSRDCASLKAQRSSWQLARELMRWKGSHMDGSR